jgi:N-acetylmuramic acid 6-phosphate etherase
MHAGGRGGRDRGVPWGAGHGGAERGEHVLAVLAGGVDVAADVEPGLGDIAAGEPELAGQRVPHRAARAAGALTILVSSNLEAPLAPLAEHCLLVDTGPEAIAGSTRLKAATAQKMLLNSLSTATMVALGRTYSNLMVALSGGNAKLTRRQITILTEASGASEQACRAELSRCNGDLRLAVVCLLSGLAPEQAAPALAAACGSVRDALGALGGGDAAGGATAP